MQTPTSKLFREYRAAQDLSQDQLARLLGVSQAAISAYESGRFEPDAERCLLFEVRLHGAITRYQLLPQVFGPAPRVEPATERAEML